MSSSPAPTGKNLLLVSPDDASCSEIPAVLRTCNPPIGAEVVRAVDEAVRRVAGRAYDAVLCTVEREHEIDFVARLREARPDVPILLVAPSGDPGLRRRCRECGADGVVGRGPGGRIRAERLCRALETLEAVRANARVADRVYAAARELRELTGKTAALLGRPRGPAPAVPGPVLLVSEDEDESEALAQALRKAGFSGEIRTASGGGEAYERLAGVKEGPGAEARERLPSLILFDAGLLPEAGYEGLRKIKGDASLRHIPVVVLASLDDDVRAAAELGINSCLLKPKDPAQIDILAQALRLYWLSLNTRLGL